MKKDLLERIKSNLKSLFSQKFTEVKAGDIIITTPDEFLVVGSEVFMIDQDGNNVPLVDGEYTLDSGEKITVLGGKVQEITSTEEEIQDVEPTEEAPVEMAEENTISSCSCDEKFTKLQAEIEELKKMFSDLSVQKEELEQKFSKISEQPAVKSIDVRPTEFKSVEDKKNLNSIDLSSVIDKVKKKVRG